MSSTSIRFNITLPRDVGLKLQASKNHSRFVAESLRATFKQQEAQRLADSLREGYQARAAADAKLDQEYDVLAGDGVVE